MRRSSFARALTNPILMRSYASVPLRLGQENFESTFSHLQETEISKYEGEFVQLPLLYSERMLAKDLRGADCKSFLLTAERLALWKEMNEASGSHAEPGEGRLDGTCLSGPNGVGKSSVLHMLASVAHVNKWIVLYIPKAGEWARKLTVDGKPDPTPASIYLLERFIELNEYHAEAIDKMQDGIWKRLIAATKGKVNPYDVEDDLLTELKKQADFSVLYAFDEHQMLFPKDGEDPMRAPVAMLPDYFRRFTSWQTGTSGSRTFTIYSGSAHSDFETKGIGSEKDRLRFIRPWKQEYIEKATRTNGSSLYIPELEKHQKLDLHLQAVTGGIPRLLRRVKHELLGQETRNPTERPETRIQTAIDMVESDTISDATDELKKTYGHLSRKDKREFITYLGNILFPAWYKGLPQKRDCKLYDKGFIFHAVREIEGKQKNVLRVVNEPARHALLKIFITHSKPKVIKLGTKNAGNNFEREVVKATLSERAESIQGRYYRQVDGPSPSILNLYATDAIQLDKNFSLPEVSLLPYLDDKGGNVIIIPEDEQFPAWDFIHYSVFVDQNEKVKRTVTFVQTTISEGDPTANGHWTADSNHPPKMKASMVNDDDPKKKGVVVKVLTALGFGFNRICYDEDKEEFIVEPKNPEDMVRFVLITASQLPKRTGEKDHPNTKFDMRNLIVVHRAEVEKLGVVLA